MAKFDKGSIFSNDINIFQKIKDGILNGCRLPKGDYRNYNFSGVKMYATVFTYDSLLPEEPDFLQKAVIRGGRVASTKWSDNVIQNIHNYDLEGISICLDFYEYKKLLTNRQIDIIKSKYPSEIGKTIILPKEVYGDESQNKLYKF